ncbi:MFS transporter [Ornithinimicrobium pekingense]|uniref:MFS transporter n=1 Tax=Ornithinimicrobium pekingense TaxID=384677 RepID=A0ABQ2FFE6_9MICO|nr:MFS transporter [Ornithinimicrobium pekingense]
MAAITFLVLLASAAFRSSLSLLLVPMEEDLGWTRTETSIAVSLNLLLYGVAAPFAAALLERVGVRRMAVWALVLIAFGCLGTTVMTAPWQLAVLWGVVIGIATGSVALVFGAIVADRWFVARRGLVVGILGAAWATGQLIFLPVLAAVVDAFGWRAASVAIALLCAALLPPVVVVLRGRPADVGALPYGATAQDTPVESSPPSAAAAVGHALQVLGETCRARAFLLLAGTFFVCGWTTNGIISTHFVPAAHDHGMPATAAAGLLAVVGVFDIVGTIGSGWLTDRFDPRLLLAVYYTLRGAALLAVPALLGPDIDPPMLVMVALFGLDWVATVPPTVVLCRAAFGPERGGIVFGWVFAAHMIGAGVAAAASGALRAASGDYTSAWLLAGGLAVAAALASLALPGPEQPPRSQPEPGSGPHRPTPPVRELMVMPLEDDHARPPFAAECGLRLPRALGRTSLLPWGRAGGTPAQADRLVVRGRCARLCVRRPRRRSRQGRDPRRGPSPVPGRAGTARRRARSPVPGSSGCRRRRW